jgi:hypothetical protein
MTWLTFHRESETLAQNAHESLRAGDKDGARRLFSQAAELERQALDSLAPGKSKTRGITAVSAAALLYKADEFEQACQLAYSQLRDNALAEFARFQLEELVQTIYNEREKRKYDVSFLPGMVNVSVKGGEVLRGAAPLDLIRPRKDDSGNVLPRYRMDDVASASQRATHEGCQPAFPTLAVAGCARQFPVLGRHKGEHAA